MMHRIGIRKGILLIALLVVAHGGWMAAMAQNEPPEPPKPSDDFFVWLISNNYIRCAIGANGTIDNEDFDCRSTVNPVGCFSLGTVAGDPTSSTDNSNFLTKDCAYANTVIGGFPFMWQCYATVAVVDVADPTMGTAYKFCQDAGYIRLGFDTGSQEKMEVAWRSPENIDVDLRVSLRRDVARFSYLITNYDTVPHSVGLRQLFAPALGAGNWNYAFRMPYTDPISREKQLVGTDVPDYITAYNMAVNPSFSNLIYWSGQDATKPNRIQLADVRGLWGVTWMTTDALLIPEFDFTETTWGGGIAAYWEPVRLDPGGSRQVVFYTGLGVATSDFQWPYVFATQSPFSLKYYNGNDTNTPDVEEKAYLQPNPFEISAYVYNRYGDQPRGEPMDREFNNVAVSISLPPGLELVAGEAATKTITRIPTDTEGSVRWQVRATGQYTGPLTYSVAVSPAPAAPKQIFRTIQIPATDAYQLVGSPTERLWQMISVPFKFDNPDANSALGLQSGTWRAYHWDTERAEWDTVPYLQLGQGFYLNSTVETFASLNSMYPEGESTRKNYDIGLPNGLPEGWNQIGIPWLYPVYWGRVHVFLPDTQEDMSVHEAVSRGFLQDLLFWWNPGTQSFERATGVDALLQPWYGYWVYIKKPCVLTFQKLDNLGASVSGGRMSAQKRDTSRLGPGWELQLCAKGRKAQDTDNFLGARRQASDGYGDEDVMSPPAFPEIVTVSFVHSDWGEKSGVFADDIRSDSLTRKEWTVDVSAAPNDEHVTLTWPSIGEVPRDWTLRICDTKTGITKYMRSTSSYSFKMDESGVRRFKIMAEPLTGGDLKITDVVVEATRAARSAGISFNVTRDAQVAVKILSLTGRPVRTVGSSKAVTRGINKVAWDMRAQDGRAVPRGMYLCEIIARTEEGEMSRVVSPMHVR